MTNFFTQNPSQKNSFLEFFGTSKDIVITSHQNPDGDAYGSSLSLYAVLKKMGHRVVVISPTDHSAYLSWLPGVSEVINFEGKEQSKAVKLIQKAEAIFCLDFSTLNRIKDMEVHVAASKAIKIIVDHHQEPGDFACYMFWNDKAAATCELLYLLFEQLEWEHLIDTDAATCLYTGILTDTGSFKFDSTTADIHRIAGKLIEKGIRPSQIHRTLFDNQSIDRLKFLGFALSERLNYLPQHRLAYFKFSQEDLRRFNSQKGDTEGVVNYGLGIEGVIFSAIFVEMEDMVKMSFRSVGDFSVSEFAREHFSGGGHKNAAGGRSFDSLADVEKKFLSLLPIYNEQLLALPA